MSFIFQDNGSVKWFTITRSHRFIAVGAQPYSFSSHSEPRGTIARLSAKLNYRCYCGFAADQYPGRVVTFRLGLRIFTSIS